MRSLLLKEIILVKIVFKLLYGNLSVPEIADAERFNNG